MPSSTPFLSIVFPAHNEEERLPETLRQVDNFVSSQPFSTEVIIVENASEDRTMQIAREFAADHSYVQVVHLDLPGKGRAVQTGMLTARGAYRFICDVDLSMPINEITRFLPPQKQDVSIAIASREAPGAVRYNEPQYRHLVGRVFNNLVRWTVLPHLQDTQCGFKCFTAETAETLFPLQTITGWTFDVEILAVANHRGYRIEEVPIQWYYQPRSKVNVWKDSLKMARDLLLIRRKLRRGDYDRPA
jgi:glycosyltransferase involved in cell wall biosynthesis